MKCRGANTRVMICSRYIVVPEFHGKVLDSMPKQSDAGPLLTDEFFLYGVYDKNPDNTRGRLVDKIICGKNVAKHLNTLIEQSGVEYVTPPLFNPLAQSSTDSEIISSKNTFTINRAQRKWHKATKQLYEAVCIIIMSWRASDPGGVLFQIRDKCLEYSYAPPFPSQVKAVNTCLARDKKKRTLTAMLKDLGQGMSLRDFCFDELDAILKTINVESRF